MDPPYPHQIKKKVVKVGPPLTKLSGSAHVYVSSEGFGESVHMFTHLSLYSLTKQEVLESRAGSNIYFDKDEGKSIKSSISALLSEL